MGKKLAMIFAAAIAASTIWAGNTLLVVPSNVQMVCLGLDLMRAVPGHLELVCYGGERKVTDIEYFDMEMNRWVPTKMAAWKKGTIPSIQADNLVLVGKSKAFDELLKGAQIGRAHV